MKNDCNWVSGSPAQTEWAGRIRQQVDAEFDRVAAAFRAVAAKQEGARAAAAANAIAVLEKIRAEVLARQDAAYFIREWQEISDQVRRLISRHPDYRPFSRREKDKE